MAKLPVYYDNKMNLLAFKNLDKVEANLFFSIVARFNDKGAEKLKLNFSEIAEFISDNKYTSKELSKLINDGVGKVVQSAIKWEMTPTKTAYFTLFNEFLVDDENKTLEASINSRFLFMLNNFKDGNFTMLELAEFSSLKSKYTQTLYRLLKQFRFTGFRSIKWAEFIEIMDIPTSYRARDIDKQILKPAITELTQEADIFNQNNPIFKKLTYKKIRGTGRGRPVEKIEFYFMPETNEPKEQRQNEKPLQYIAQDIRKEQMLKELKRSSQEQPKKINPFTGKEITGLEPYKLRNMRFKNKFGEYDILKIQNIEQEPSGKIIVTVRNVDDNHINTMKFDSLKHFENTFNLHQM
ncbi:replication initiation protein [Campylobacter fetus subsp. venerealis]|uniref:replication initiation protein n=2 Tax=Campylobacter TaxID=194 RepID=UPI001909AF5A|nr:replication initiation protein [Campylobacter fetus]MBK3487693.1 replication initiation protein [Campylobacter fetus subsp. venerealis]